MPIATKPHTFSLGDTIVAGEHNSNFDTLYALVNGNLDNTNISGSAAISDAKLAQITTASKVSGASITSLASIPSGAGRIPGVNGGVPAGVICMWSGTILTIPTGWVLCNGSNGTPDLRDKFVIGARQDDTVAKTNVTGALTQSGGSTTIAIGNLPAVVGTVTRYDGNGDGSTGVQGTTNGSNPQTQNITGGSGTAYLQPYFALAYIMKT